MDVAIAISTSSLRDALERQPIFLHRVSLRRRQRSKRMSEFPTSTFGAYWFHPILEVDMVRGTCTFLAYRFAPCWGSGRGYLRRHLSLALAPAARAQAAFPGATSHHSEQHVSVTTRAHVRKRVCPTPRRLLENAVSDDRLAPVRRLQKGTAGGILPSGRLAMPHLRARSGTAQPRDQGRARRYCRHHGNNGPKI